jgi:coenzyme F420-reducing hydrogenase alpha subunit
MASALSRLNLNYKQLTDGAKEVAEMFGLEPVCHNPYMNTIAQLVEIMHSLEDSIDLVDKVIAMGLEEEEGEVEVRPGRGVGAVAVPRGILFHDYTIDEVGNCVKANCIIPTNQNHGNIQQDMEAMAPKLVNMPEKEIELRLEMLVRAYDPCISCSTHYVKVNFV